MVRYDTGDYGRMGHMMTTEPQPPPTTTELASAKAQAIVLAAALHSIISEAQEGEIIRTALAALQSTSTGRDYLAANPIRY